MYLSLLSQSLIDSYFRFSPIFCCCNEYPIHAALSTCRSAFPRSETALIALSNCPLRRVYELIFLQCLTVSPSLHLHQHSVLANLSIFANHRAIIFYFKRLMRITMLVMCSQDCAEKKENETIRSSGVRWHVWSKTGLRVWKEKRKKLRNTEMEGKEREREGLRRKIPWKEGYFPQ